MEYLFSLKSSFINIKILPLFSEILNINKMTTKEKVLQLRNKMAEKGVDAFIVFSADPHLSEYLPTEWQERAWISGFTGSAGFVVFTKDKAGLWTDGRYFTQATIELENSGIDLMKDGVEGTPHYIDWVLSEIPKGGVVAVNALVTSNANWELMEERFEKGGAKLKNIPLLDEIWLPRPEASKNVVFTQPVERAGQSVQSKLDAIRQKMSGFGATAHIISSLDDVAWTLNLRGSDVKANPVFLGYIYLTTTDVTLFVDTQKLNQDAKNQLAEANVQIVEYIDFFQYLANKVSNQKILISPNTNQKVFDTLRPNNTFMKAQKNPVELEGFRIAMEKDGVAMVKFLYWLTHEAGKTPMNEYSIGVRLREFRAEQQNFVGESFDSIIGYNGNGAIIHYSAKEEGSKSVTNSGTILVDSGGQYLEGTTDITRTLALGSDVSEEFKIDYTLVMKGHIQLSMVKFPKGTRGVQLDAYARMALWQAGKDYNHGTGHGVGSFMNVHEGPQNIRKELNPVELLPGMVVSNEPGFYLVNKYGIRLENLVAVIESETTDFGPFYEFETLTICPFFTDVIVKELLTPEEKQWLNDYHRLCEEKLSKHLEGDIKEWFLNLVKPI